jgi:hypothetical protein
MARAEAPTGAAQHPLQKASRVGVAPLSAAKIPEGSERLHAGGGRGLGTVAGEQADRARVVAGSGGEMAQLLVKPPSSSPDGSEVRVTRSGGAADAVVGLLDEVEGAHEPAAAMGGCGCVQEPVGLGERIRAHARSGSAAST